MSDLTERLRALSRAEHDDHSVGDLAAIMIKQLELEVECEERRFNRLTDDFAALSKKNDKMREVLTELQQCSEYWSEYDVPLGIHDRIKEALKDDA